MEHRTPSQYLVHTAVSTLWKITGKQERAVIQNYICSSRLKQCKILHMYRILSFVRILKNPSLLAATVHPIIALQEALAGTIFPMSDGDKRIFVAPVW